jgi:hypothetical protein
MNITLLLTFQLIADAVLCIAVVFLFSIVNREIKTKSVGPDRETLAEFKRLIVESQHAAENLLSAMDESRKILKEISYAVDDKERTLRKLIDASEMHLSTWKDTDKRETSIHTDNKDDRYEKAIELAGQGLEDHEIAELSGLTDGEVRLILELNRKKNESV